MARAELHVLGGRSGQHRSVERPAIEALQRKPVSPGGEVATVHAAGFHMAQNG